MLSTSTLVYNLTFGYLYLFCNLFFNLFIIYQMVKLFYEGSSLKHACQFHWFCCYRVPANTRKSVNQSHFRVSALQYVATMYEHIKHCKFNFVAIMDILFEKRLVSFYGLFTIPKLLYLLQIVRRTIDEIRNCIHTFHPI